MEALDKEMEHIVVKLYVFEVATGREGPLTWVTIGDWFSTGSAEERVAEVLEYVKSEQDLPLVEKSYWFQEPRLVSEGAPFAGTPEDRWHREFFGDTKSLIA